MGYRLLPAILATTAAVLGLAVAPAPAAATQIQAVYSFSAQSFVDSNFDPPPAPTSIAVSGTFSFTFDDAALPQLELVPDSVTGVDITYNNGVTMDFDTTNSGVNVNFGNAAGEARIVFGATVNSVAFMVGLSNDFRLSFDVFLADGALKAVIEDFTFNSTVDPFYKGPTIVTPVSWTVVPEPGSAVLLALGLAGLAMRRGTRR